MVGSHGMQSLRVSNNGWLTNIGKSCSCACLKHACSLGPLWLLLVNAWNARRDKAHNVSNGHKQRGSPWSMKQNPHAHTTTWNVMMQQNQTTNYKNCRTYAGLLTGLLLKGAISTDGLVRQVRNRPSASMAPWCAVFVG